MNKRPLEKFFTNQTTPEETEKVLDWFDTPEGKQCLQESLNIDYDLMDRKELRDMITELDSDELYRSIQKGIGKKRNFFSLKRTDRLGYAVKAAAAILVILTASLFTIIHQRYTVEQFVDREPIQIWADNDEHREITLSDGSMVRLNSDSKIIISKDFMRGTREIELTGEAFFEVAHNPNQPFIIHANESVVEVLGTSFNVRSYPDQENVQVAVIEGKISFANTAKHGEQENLSIVLTKGQFGYMDVNERTILVDDLAVENYLAWKNGRFKFEKLTMQQVCTQLNRIYSIECNFVDDQIRSLQLTANFTSESLEKTLEVISMSLELEYERQDNVVKWSDEHLVHFNEAK